MTASAAMPDTFVISLPTGWVEIPLDPATLVAEATRVAEQTKPPELVESIDFRRQMLLLKRVAEQAELAGLVLLAVFAERVADESNGGESAAVLSALCYLATVRAERLGTDRITFEHITTAVDLDSDDAGLQRVQRPDVVDLTAGTALRDVVVHETEIEGTRMSALSCRFHLVVGAGEAMAVLGFATPNLGLADEFLELFGSIAQTLELVTA